MEVKRGTTTVGIVGEKFVVLAADKLASLGDLAFDVRTKKIIQIGPRMAITVAGSVGDAQMLARFLKAKIQRMTVEEGEPSPGKIANFVATVLNANRFFPYLTELVLGGYKDRGYAYAIDPVGGVSEVYDYTATGSGSPVAFGVLEAEYDEKMGVDDAVKLAIKAVEAARRRNVFTGGRGAGIDVAVIDGKGVRFLSEEEVVAHK